MFVLAFLFAHVSRDELAFSTPLLTRIAVGCGSSTKPGTTYAKKTTVYNY